MITLLDSKGVAKYDNETLKMLNSQKQIAQISNFLKAFRAEAARSGLIFVRRRKNMDFLAFLGILPCRAEEVIENLTAANYFEGPVPDDDGSSGDVWKFATEVQGNKIYIKLKLSPGEAKCLSFHALEYPVTFPFG